MLYGQEPHSSQLVLATPGGKAVCPLCKSSLIARCGELRVHHWAHADRDECDPWFEPESEWHLAWKRKARRVEVVMPPHRADIVNRLGHVIELQHSSLSPVEIAEREAFYGEMVWLVDASPFLHNLFVLEHYGKASLYKFRWKNARLGWQQARRPVFLDLGSATAFERLFRERFTFNSFRESSGDEQLLMPKKLQKSGLSEATAGLAPSLECTILEIRTLHENGFGSIRLWREDQFIKRLVL